MIKSAITCSFIIMKSHVIEPILVGQWDLNLAGKWVQLHSFIQGNYDPVISIIAIYNSMDSSGGDWAIISIDGAITRAKIVHKSRGRYVIVEDSKEGKYINRVIDAGDIIQVEK